MCGTHDNLLCIAHDVEYSEIESLSTSRRDVFLRKRQFVFSKKIDFSFITVRSFNKSVNQCLIKVLNFPSSKFYVLRKKFK